MVDFFNNREMAVAVWIVAIVIYIISSSKMKDARECFWKVLSAFFVRQIISVLILMIIYMGCVIYFMSMSDLWNKGQIKNTIFWAVAVGFISLFKLESIKSDKNFFKKSVIDNIKILTILQFIVSFYVFPLWVELLLLPVLVFVGGMSAIAETDEKYNQVKKVLDGIMVFFGVGSILYALYMLLNNFDDFAKKSTFDDFVVPALLTIFYLPFVFMMMVYTTYEQAFVGLVFSIKENKIRLLAKVYAILFFNFRLSLLDRWKKHIFRNKISSHKDLIESFKHIRKMVRLENVVGNVPFEEGWSPYIAKDFLCEKGLATGYYSMYFENEWHALSPMLEIGCGIIPDNIAYYVEGVEGVAKILKLKLNINDSSRAKHSRDIILNFAETLIQRSLSMDITEVMKNSLLSGNPCCEKYGNKEVSVSIDFWRGHKFNGHDIKFVISSI